MCRRRLLRSWYQHLMLRFRPTVRPQVAVTGRTRSTALSTISLQLQRLCPSRSSNPRPTTSSAFLSLRDRKDVTAAMQQAPRSQWMTAYAAAVFRGVSIDLLVAVVGTDGTDEHA